MMTTDIQAAVERLREAITAERPHFSAALFSTPERRATDAALAELERLLAAGAAPPDGTTWRDEVLTLGRLESLLLRAELAGGSPAAALRDAVQKELH